jgi:hypothetical protein
MDVTKGKGKGKNDLGLATTIGETGRHVWCQTMMYPEYLPSSSPLSPHSWPI